MGACRRDGGLIQLPRTMGLTSTQIIILCTSKTHQTKLLYFENWQKKGRKTLTVANEILCNFSQTGHISRGQEINGSRFQLKIYFMLVWSHIVKFIFAAFVIPVIKSFETSVIPVIKSFDVSRYINDCTTKTAFQFNETFLFGSSGNICVST